MSDYVGKAQYLQQKHGSGRKPIGLTEVGKLVDPLSGHRWNKAASLDTHCGQILLKLVKELTSYWENTKTLNAFALQSEHKCSDLDLGC